MRELFSVALWILALPVICQEFAIGSLESTFYDADRDRQIGTVVHFPAPTAGNNSEVAAGEFPVLIFGHGFLMGVDAYENFRDHFVADGYILVLPTTEGGFPDHGEFGADLAFLANAMQALGLDTASIFNGHIAPATALLGHSMGGGASMLAGALNSTVHTIVNFAAAETDPSAIAAAEQITVPTLMFAASEDCVTPIGEHQQPMYNALSSSCKALVNIQGGGHCYFANSNFTCELGEFTCFPDLSIERAGQHDVVNDLAGAWLDAFLRNDDVAYVAFLDSAALSERVEVEHTCITTDLPEEIGSSIMIHPVPANDHLVVSTTEPIQWIEIIDVSGRSIRRTVTSDPIVGVGDLPEGTYQLRIGSSGRASIRRFVVVR